MEITYLGGSLPDDMVDALTAAVSEAIADAARGLLLTITTQHHHDGIRLSTTVRAGSSLEAITYLNTAVDDAMFRTGVFEQFDVTGKQLQIAPLEIYNSHDSSGPRRK